MKRAVIPAECYSTYDRLVTAVLISADRKYGACQELIAAEERAERLAEYVRRSREADRINQQVGFRWGAF